MCSMCGIRDQIIKMASGVKIGVMELDSGLH